MLLPHLPSFWASLVAQRVKRLPAVQETWVRSLGQEDPLEKEMATHSSTLAWKTPWTEKPGRLQSMGSQRVGHSLVTSPSLKKIRREAWSFFFSLPMAHHGATTTVRAPGFNQVVFFVHEQVNTLNVRIRKIVLT